MSCLSSGNSRQLALLLSVLILTLIPLYRALKRARLRLPPGPKGWPLIGNLLDLPQTNFVESYTEWAQKYGLWFHPS